MQRNRGKQQSGKDQRSRQENNRYQGIISCKDGLDKDRNGMDLKESEDIKKMWQEFAEELDQKDLPDPDNHDGVITHLVSDSLEYEVKWPQHYYEETSGGDGIPGKLFQVLKDDAVKVLHSICQQIGKLSTGRRTGKGQFSFQGQRKHKLWHSRTHLSCQ